MWVFPVVAAAVAVVFSALVARQYVARRRPHQLAWVIALAMYAAASFAVVFGMTAGWTPRAFEVYWALGAVLNVPFLAGGELMLLVRNSKVRAACWVVLVFVTSYTVSVLRGASYDEVALLADLPSGRAVLGGGSPAQRLPQLISTPSYLVLVAGVLWSAWTLRGRPEQRERFMGTLLIALGATLIAGFGSYFAFNGRAAAFSGALAAGIAVMFAGFLRASGRANARASAPSGSTAT